MMFIHSYRTIGANIPEEWRALVAAKVANSLVSPAILETRHASTPRIFFASVRVFRSCLTDCPQRRAICSWNSCLKVSKSFSLIWAVPFHCTTRMSYFYSRPGQKFSVSDKILVGCLMFELLLILSPVTAPFRAAGVNQYCTTH